MEVVPVFTHTEYGICTAICLSMLRIPFAVILCKDGALFKSAPEVQAETLELSMAKVGHKAGATVLAIHGGHASH